MAMFEKLLSKRNKTIPFRGFFFEDTERNDHPYRLAVHSLRQLQETTNSQEELYMYMVEDILFASIYATFYEHLLFTVNENSLIAAELIEAFQKDAPERERIIAEQSEYHMQYIINEGHCSGCPACENHADVNEIVPLFHGGDFGFFKTLYLGMQTIQIAMEELIYDLTPERPEWHSSFTPESILKFRQDIIEFVENKKAC